MTDFPQQRTCKPSTSPAFPTWAQVATICVLQYLTILSKGELIYFLLEEDRTTMTWRRAQIRMQRLLETINIFESNSCACIMCSYELPHNYYDGQIMRLRIWGSQVTFRLVHWEVSNRLDQCQYNPIQAFSTFGAYASLFRFGSFGPTSPINLALRTQRFLADTHGE
jgi:hypothetical protein